MSNCSVVRPAGTDNFCIERIERRDCTERIDVFTCWPTGVWGCSGWNVSNVSRLFKIGYSCLMEALMNNWGFKYAGSGLGE